MDLQITGEASGLGLAFLIAAVHGDHRGEVKWRYPCCTTSRT
ncbi:hypothetical protein [Ornithinimicrobium murale]|nr:hypothetical protein [Ornithinimicrobium murale]